MLTNDANLIRLEPNLFQEVQWLSQRLVNASGAVSGTTLTISAFDTDFAGAQLEVGMVVLINEIAHEVLARLSPTAAQISRIRARSDFSALTPAPVTGAEVIVSTFRPQISVTSEHILQSLGLDPAAATPPLLIDTQPLARLATVSTLAAIYASASEVSAQAPLAQRAERYRLLVALERAAAKAPLDDNTQRRPCIIPLNRV